MEKEIEKNDLINPTICQSTSFSSSVEELKGGSDAFAVRNPWGYGTIKRLFDIVASFCAIIILSPLMLVVGLLVVLTSKGPAIFVSKRVGKNGKTISVLKFRSMFIDAESNIGHYLTPSQQKQWEKEKKLDNDPRITRIGRFIRKTSIDELPQFFNVFIGSMSLVGPRPVTSDEIDENYTKPQKAILLSAKPGITGYWQVYGRSDVVYANGKRQAEELLYVSKRSLLFDLRLLVLTFPRVFSHRGAK